MRVIFVLAVLIVREYIDDGADTYVDEDANIYVD